MPDHCAFRAREISPQALQVEFVGQGQTVPVNFRLLTASSSGLALDWNAQAQAAAGLIPAMRSGSVLSIDGHLEPSFHSNIRLIQGMLGFWDKDLTKIAVEADVAAASRNPARAAQALFFSGGVDSMFSLLQHADTITDLIYVHGFDVPLAATSLRRSISDYLTQVADLFAVNLVEVETDLRSLLDANTSWLYGHGPAIATIAHLLASWYSRILIAGTYSYAKLLPCGTHPLLDPLWSTAATEFTHDGADVARADKVARIALNPAARRLLRVCWIAPTAAQLNCCKCEKCLRTMVTLQAVDALHSNEAFPVPLDLARVKALELTDITRDLWEENRQLLTITGSDPRLLAAVENLLKPRAGKRIASRIRVWNRQRRQLRRQRRQENNSEPKR